MTLPPLTHLRWMPCWRVIPSRFPPISLFERVARPEDMEAVFLIEGLTNARLRDEVGDLSLVPAPDRIAGPGTSYIMAAFTHLPPAGSRFTDGRFGVYFAAMELATAVAESRFHRERFLAATREPPIEVDMRVIAADLDARLHDIRDWRAARPELYDPDSHLAAQELARQLRDGGSTGLCYASLRDEGGQCVAIFRPPALANARQERHLCYRWDGRRISEIYEKSGFRA